MLVRKLLLTACLAAPVALVSAQQTPPAKSPPPAPPPARQLDFPPLTGGELRLDDRGVAGTTDIQRVTRFANATDPETVASANDRALLDRVIKYYLYRLTWEEVQEAREPQKSGTITLIMNDIIGGSEVTTTFRLLPRVDTRTLTEPDDVARRNRQLAYVRLATPIFTHHLREVLKSQA